LLRPLLRQLDPARKTLAIIDSTDLPAAAHSFKKNNPAARPGLPPWAHAPSRAA
jgi:hypothetical protein